jgi:hypothetical protein
MRQNSFSVEMWVKGDKSKNCIFRQKMKSSGNKFFIFGLVLLLLLNYSVDSVDGKLIFCGNCRPTRNAIFANPQPNDTTVKEGNILAAPNKCKPGLVLDKRNNCRKLVFNNWMLKIGYTWTNFEKAFYSLSRFRLWWKKNSSNIFKPKIVMRMRHCHSKGDFLRNAIESD